MITERKLAQIKDKIALAQQELSEKKAEKKLLIDRLKKELKVDSLDEVYEKIEKMEMELDKKKSRRDKILEEIEGLIEQYE